MHCTEPDTFSSPQFNSAREDLAHKYRPGTQASTATRLTQSFTSWTRTLIKVTYVPQDCTVQPGHFVAHTYTLYASPSSTTPSRSLLLPREQLCHTHQMQVRTSPNIPLPAFHYWSQNFSSLHRSDWFHPKERSEQLCEYFLVQGALRVYTPSAISWAHKGIF